MLGYILRQDLIDFLKLIQTIGSAVAGLVLYYGIVTPYGFVLRLFGVLRRARIRPARASAQVPLDPAFWNDA